MLAIPTQNKLAIFALAIAAFAIGTTEFVTTGLLSNLAHAFHISISMAGLVTSGYAIGIVIGGPFITAATIQLPRRHLLIILLVLFVIGSILSALAPSFEILLLGRVLSAFSHGAFFGVSSVVATSLVPSSKKSSAIAWMFSGLTLANVLGVPMGTLLGQHFGWRAPFLVIAALGMIGVFSIWKFIPRKLDVPKTNFKVEIKAFTTPKIWIALAITALGFSGLLASFAYMEPMLTRITHFSGNAIVWLLGLYGSGLVIGNIIGGKYADKHLMPTLYTSLSSLAIILFAFTVTIHYKVAAAILLFTLGMISFATIPALQTFALKTADSAPTLSSTANIAAFNLGVTIGVSVAGAAISHGFGLASPNWIGALLSFSGLTLLLAYHLKFRNDTSYRHCE